MHPISEKQRQKLHAQMAESVDALVSNTSGATRAGSTPALGTSVQNLRTQSAVSQKLMALFVDKERAKCPLLLIPTLSTSRNSLNSPYHFLECALGEGADAGDGAAELPL